MVYYVKMEQIARKGKQKRLNESTRTPPQHSEEKGDGAPETFLSG